MKYIDIKNAINKYGENTTLKEILNTLLTGKEICPACNGYGETDGYEMDILTSERCFMCNGEGLIKK
jgi:DnaJ-class molecular chaperone